eukprot:COSAG02_NODE_2692_length_8222_cov_6.872584_3_plen_157_part_00
MARIKYCIPPCWSGFEASPSACSSSQHTDLAAANRSIIRLLPATTPPDANSVDASGGSTVRAAHHHIAAAWPPLHLLAITATAISSRCTSICVLLFAEFSLHFLIRKTRRSFSFWRLERWRLIKDLVRHHQKTLYCCAAVQPTCEQLLICLEQVGA